MTKRKFQHRYPNGLSKTSALFEKSLYQIMTTDEIDRIINNAKRREKRQLKAFKNAYLDGRKDWSCPIWAVLPLMQHIPSLFVDVLALMAMSDKEVYHGEDEE